MQVVGAELGINFRHETGHRVHMSHSKVNQTNTVSTNKENYAHSMRTACIRDIRSQLCQIRNFAGSAGNRVLVT